MTTEEFFKTYRGLNPKTRMVGNAIRVDYKGQECCPVAFVCNALKGTHLTLEMHEAGKMIGLSTQQVIDLASAADRCNQGPEGLEYRRIYLGLSEASIRSH